MTKRDVVVIGASAGGVEALRALVANLPADLPATVLVVLHLAAGAHSVLPAILQRATKMRVVGSGDLRESSPLTPGTMYVAPPDHHLTLRDNDVHLSRGPPINGHRPAVDPLFRTAARFAGPRAIGVILSGVLDDGASGMVAIKRAGGATLVQDPRDALYSGMPQSVLEQIEVDASLTAAELGNAIVRLAGQPVHESGTGGET